MLARGGFRQSLIYLCPVRTAYGKLRGTQPCLCTLLFQLFQLRQFFARRRPALVRQRHGLLTSCLNNAEGSAHHFLTGHGESPPICLNTGARRGPLPRMDLALGLVGCTFLAVRELSLITSRTV